MHIIKFDNNLSTSLIGAALCQFQRGNDLNWLRFLDLTGRDPIHSWHFWIRSKMRRRWSGTWKWGSSCLIISQLSWNLTSSSVPLIPWHCTFTFPGLHWPIQSWQVSSAAPHPGKTFWNKNQSLFLWCIGSEVHGVLCSTDCLVCDIVSKSTSGIFCLTWLEINGMQSLCSLPLSIYRTCLTLSVFRIIRSMIHLGSWTASCW